MLIQTRCHFTSSHTKSCTSIYSVVIPIHLNKEKWASVYSYSSLTNKVFLFGCSVYSSFSYSSLTEIHSNMCRTSPNSVSNKKVATPKSKVMIVRIK